MYEDLIKGLEPKPKFNLKWYKDEDLYSEGEIEDVIIELIVNNEPEDYVQTIADNYNWSVYYHLTSIRKNILNWYPFNKEGEVLEIGCGMGAITSTLCDKCKKVTAVELSKKRAIGTLLRCREKENLEIIVGNLNDIEFDKKYDYITLIGVLEYQGSYTDTDNPYLDFLKKVKGLLKPDGKLLIAIENQYGLKYWCGAREDHTAVPFDGMNQYSLSNRKVRTFSKDRLEKMVKESGFNEVFFYYPMPDYKLPTVIYSQNSLPKDGNMFNMEYYYVPDGSTMTAKEADIYADLIDNGVFEFFANSFLVECTDQGAVGEVTFASLSCKRYAEYQIGTRFTNHDTVEKFPLYPQLGQIHMKEILDNEERLEQSGIKVVSSVSRGDCLETPYCKMNALEDILSNLYEKKDIDNIYRWWGRIYQDILQSSKEVPWNENLMYTFGLEIVPSADKYGPILETGYLDMIPRNAFADGEDIYWFDQEWKLEHIPAKYILYRAILEFYCSHEKAGEVVTLTELAIQMGIALIWKDFEQINSLFNSVVIDSVLLAETRGFSSDNRNDIIKNIQKLIQ